MQCLIILFLIKFSAITYLHWQHLIRSLPPEMDDATMSNPACSRCHYSFSFIAECKFGRSPHCFATRPFSITRCNCDVGVDEKRTGTGHTDGIFVFVYNSIPYMIPCKIHYSFLCSEFKIHDVFLSLWGVTYR